MIARTRLTRLVVVAVTAAGLSVGTGTAVADPSANALEQRSENAGGANGAEHRSANAPGGEVTAVDDNRPAGGGQGRKIG